MAINAAASPRDLQPTPISQNPRLVHQTDQAGDTPLHYALREHTFAYIDLLLQNGADPLQADSEGKTALHRLAEKLSTDQKASALFKHFLETGVDINTRDKEGNTPLLRYMRHGFMVPLPPFEFFRPWEAPSEGFSERAFEVFQEAGADFFTCNDYGISSLHLLASTDFVRQYASRDTAISEIVQRFKFLMDLGLDPMAEDAQQRTSLDVAAACGNEHVLKLFKREPVE